MPVARGISICLESQFDIMTIPEFPIPEVAISPNLDDTNTRTLNLGSSVFVNNPSPPLTQSRSGSKTDNIVNVLVPTYAASQFWIVYSISPFSVSLAPEQTKFMFFKLVLGGNCIVSWGVGEEHEWKGKTMWAFCRGEDGGNGWRTVEKKGFFFQSTEKDQEFDIQVYRARGRRRASREFGEKVPASVKDFDLVNFGRLKEHHPQRFYEYALQDPLDQPYVVFRYHLRAWRQLKEMGIVVRSGSNSSDSNSSSSQEPSSPVDDSGHTQQPSSRPRRLSVPPSIRLILTTTGTDPCSPMKLDSESETDNDENDDARSMNTVIHRKWIVRTPSPFNIELAESED